VYGVPGTGKGAAADIAMEGNVGYGVTNRNNPSQDESYEYI
jgi:hypothetical protein